MSKQQRRKGNAKNASSAAAHGYLSQGGAAFVGLTPEMNIFTELKVGSSNQIHHVSEIDDETRIVMKKLTKKDCLTREKGLKELLELVNSENTTVDTCYKHFVGLAPQLTTDGSPSVRMLTMKLILQFLLKLKKSASGGLKKIIPLVIFAKSDVTNGVAAAATTVLRDGFSADKKRTLIEVFGLTAFEMAAGIAQGTHELALPVDYDASEDQSARKARLETQSLNVFLSFIREFGNEWRVWEPYAQQLFQNADYVKRVFAGNRETLKVQLLTIGYRLSNCAEVLLSVPCTVPYIQNTLDVQTFTPECATAWEGLVLLIPDEKFQSKVSLVKGVLPRVLNVVRKKGVHWRVLKHYLLPAVSVLLQELKSPEGELKTMASVLDSFTDNLPWAVEVSLNSIHCWFHTFADFVRWSVTSDRVNLEILKTIVPLTIKMSEQAMLFNTLEAAECVTDLIFWMLEKKVLDALETRRFCQTIESKIIEIGREKSRLFADCLTKSGRFEELSYLHATLLTNPDLVDFKIVRNLGKSESDYFRTTIAKISDFAFVEHTEQFDASQSEDVVELILRILDSEDHQKTLSVEVRNDFVGRALLLSGNEKFWESRLKKTSESVLKDMIDYWHEKRNGKANAIAVNFLRKMGVELDIKEAGENVDFLISLLSTSSDGNVEKNSLVLKLFIALFESEDEPKQEHFQLLADNLSADFDADGFFDQLFSEESIMETERILEVSERFDTLMGLCDENSRKILAEKTLLAEEEADEIGPQTHYLELDVLTYSEHSTLLTDAFMRPSKCLEKIETLSIVKRLGRKTLFNLASKYHTGLHQLVGWQVSGIIECVKQRYRLAKLDEELESLKEEIEKRLVHTDVTEDVRRNGAPNFLADSLKWTLDQEKAFYRGYPEELNEKIDTVFFAAESSLKYMEHVFEASQSETSFPLFQFDHSNQDEWLANLRFAKQFVQCGGNIFGTDNFELRDFALCGMVTVLDHATDTITTSPNAFDTSPLLETLAALYTELFVILDEAANGDSYPEQSVEEWKEFYSPTMRTYFIRLSRAVRKEQQPTPMVRSLLKVLLSAMRKFPDDMVADESATREFVPELAEFAYPAFQESCISHAFSLFASHVEHVQLIGYAIAKLLMPIMFKAENASALKADDDAEVSVPERRKLSLPVMIEKTYPRHQTHAHSAVLLLDLALTPLETPDESFGQEQRVSYCDTIDPFIKHALNALLLEQPFDFKHVPIACRIPRNQERDYYLTSDLSASPVFFDKFACRLLFKSITLLPAAVRLFHKNMPNCFMPMFQEAVTKYASKLLIEQELAKVRLATFGNEMKVRTVAVTGEIIAEYVVEETKMKLTIGLPADYPLSVPTMTLDKAIVKSDRAKKWLLQLNAYLFHQNGAILEGIEMWKRNVDKGVEGVEDCTICMMTVHQTTHQLPKIKCKQCKNKFHSNCLYKWFESSNQSTCPLCRNNFT